MAVAAVAKDSAAAAVARDSAAARGLAALEKGSGAMAREGCGSVASAREEAS